ncbi:CheR family methyltransferase [Sulfurivermis fontis]|uniref:CheR family methyltransferase n=1 Tax=Sulfurivermis fontis TaxID=1972068 RepID=UPI000FD9254B|nr:protein-glutamate O-methyltransferase CheR [Sulfurivermis fontis]
MTTTHIAPNEYEEFRRFLEDACGIMLGDNKHYLVTSRLTRLMREFGITTFSELMVQLKQKHHTRLRERIVDAMTTNETMWFRDRYPFDILTNIILPEYSSLKSRQLRIWSAACSSGQEPYSISMVIQEYLAAKPGTLTANIQIVATDISPSVLKEASNAQYDKMSITRGISEERVKRFFTQRGERWEVKPEIRGRVSFREMNLMQSYAALGKFDIVFCRNVLIYFSSELKKDILTRIAQSMNPRGYLFLGGSESPTSYVDMFEMVRTAYGVVYRLKTGYR